MTDEQIISPTEITKIENVAASTEPITSDKNSTVESTNIDSDINNTEEKSTADVSEEDKINAIVKKRVARENRKVTQAQQEADFWKAEALKNQQATSQSQQQEVSSKPSLAQFNNDYEAYTDALTEYKLQQRDIQQLQQKRQDEQTKLASNYAKLEADFVKINPDYFDALEDIASVPVHNDIRQAIWESDIGPALAYHLAQNPDEIENLNSLSSHKRLLELGKIEDRLMPKKANATKAPTKATPAPVTPVNGKAPNLGKSIYEMSKDELRAHLQQENKAAIAKRNSGVRK